MKKQKKKKKNKAALRQQRKKANRKVNQKIKRKSFRTSEEVLWNDLTFLGNYSQMKCSELLEEIFKTDLDGWVEFWVEPKNITEANKLFDEQIVYDILREQLEMSLSDWSKDTNGFTGELVPEKFKFSEKSLQIFLNNIQKELPPDEWNEEVKEEALHLAQNNKVEWFLNVHDSFLHELSLQLANHIASELRIQALRYENGLM